MTLGSLPDVFQDIGRPEKHHADAGLAVGAVVPTVLKALGQDAEGVIREARA